jgi:intraflagellar transport protein 56
MIVGGAKRKNPSDPSKSNRRKEDQPQESAEDYIRRCIDTRDYSGAITYLEFSRDELNQPYTREFALWNAYCLFHNGRYSDAIVVYEQLLKQYPEDSTPHLYIASCQYYNHDFEDARASALLGPACDLRVRLLFHIAKQMNDEQAMYQAHSDLVSTLENQLSLGAIHYMRSHYQEAIEVYQRLLVEHPDYVALHVYIAMCQFKLEQYQESNETVDMYLSENSDSAVALNLKACDYFKLFDASIAESQLLQIQKFSSASYDFALTLATHNLCIFHGGVDGFTTLPRLVGSLDEARYNLAVLYMRENNPAEANAILGDWQPVETNGFMLRATVLLALGQGNEEASQIEEANSILTELGGLDHVKDTIPGRECLASTKFIVGEYDEALRVLLTIEELVSDLDEFNYDKAMTLASLSKWDEAERYFLQVKNAAYTKEKFYLSWLCRCHIKNRKPDAAWRLYRETPSLDDAKMLLHIIASDCYTTSQYYYSMLAYDILVKYEPDQSFRAGLVASAVGVFRGVLTKKEPSARLGEIVSILAQEPQAAQVLQTIQQYAIDSGEFDGPDY